MRGELYINVTSTPLITPTRFGLPAPSGGVSTEGPSWYEETEKEEGWWLFKRKEKQSLPIKGMRCLGCGYVELYVC